jgi:hypothetical protein
MCGEEYGLSGASIENFPFKFITEQIGARICFLRKTSLCLSIHLCMVRTDFLCTSSSITVIVWVRIIGLTIHKNVQQPFKTKSAKVTRLAMCSIC